MKPPIPLHNPAFVYVPAASHAADSTRFRERQQARMAAAQAKPINVAQLRKGQR